MNCAEFAVEFDRCMCGTVDADQTARLAAHATECTACSGTWREFDELQTTVATVLEGSQFRSGFSSEIADRAYHSHFGSSTSPAPRGALSAIPKPTASASPVAIAPMQLPSLLVAVALGFVIGFILGNEGSSAESVYAQIFAASRGGGGGMPPLMTFGSTADILRTMLMLGLLLWGTRTRAWEALYSDRLPGGITVCRFLALPIALIGCVRILCMLVFLLVSLASGGGRFGGFGGNSDVAILILVVAIASWTWSVGFWLVVFLMLFSVVNELTNRVVKSGG